MPHTDFRLPAEWEPQAATLLAWPSPRTDWATRLPGIQQEYTLFIRAIAQRQQVILLIPPGSTEAQDRLGDLPGLKLIELPYDDTWCRDYGPITLIGGQGGERLALDFFFGGWGGKYAAGRDNRVNTLLARHPLFERLKFRQYLFELEGGAIESDGHGTLLINWHCLHTRHPHLKRGEIEFELKALLNLERVIGIDIEPLVGDDTDGHIDTITRFVNDSTVVSVLPEESDPNYRILRDNYDKLTERFEVIPLPHPAPIRPEDWREELLPATYANFLILNDAVLVPAYRQPDRDQAALRVLRDAFPDREVLPLDCGDIIWEGGALHCLSMQEPV